MPILLIFLLTLTASKELLYFNEELLVIVSFILFLTVISLSIGGLVGASLDASIREVTEGVSSKILDYTDALEVNRMAYLNQVAASSKCSSLVAASLDSLFMGVDSALLKVSTLNRLLNVVMARSLVESNQIGFQELSAPSVVLEPAIGIQLSALAGVPSLASDSCFIPLPAEALILTVLNSLLISSLR